MNDENFGHNQRPRQNRVYVRRRAEDPTKAANIEGSASIVRVAGEVAVGALDASHALLASSSSSLLFAEVTLLDPARLEADIVSQLYLGSSTSFIGVDRVSPLVRDRQVRSLLSPSAYSASPLYSSNVAPAHIFQFNNMVDHSASVVVNPAIPSVGSHYSLPVDLDLGVYGGVPCDA